MKRIIFAFALASLMSSSLFADNQWIGEPGTSGITKATIKKIRLWSGNNIVFYINESSTSVPATRYWNISLNDTWGKNAYALLLSAKATGAPIEIYETTGTGDSFTCTALNINQ